MPVKLEKGKDKLWTQNDTMTEYYGRRIECKDDTDIFTADVFPCFQVAMMKKYSKNPNEKPVISLNELKFSQSVEGYVELIPDMQAIQYYVRGRGKGQRGDCQKMLEKIEIVIDQQLTERSPGTHTVKKYLSSSEVKKLEDLHTVRGYTKEQLKDAIKTNGIVCEVKTGNTDEVESIICKGYDMMFLEECGLDCKLEWGMTRQAKEALTEALDTQRYTRDDYRGLAEACGITESALDQMEQQQKSSSISVDILDKWCTEKSPTVGELISILCTPGLVDNDRAKTAIMGMLRRYAGTSQQVCVLSMILYKLRTVVEKYSSAILSKLSYW